MSHMEWVCIDLLHSILISAKKSNIECFRCIANTQSVAGVPKLFEACFSWDKIIDMELILSADVQDVPKV